MQQCTRSAQTETELFWFLDYPTLLCHLFSWLPLSFIIMWHTEAGSHRNIIRHGRLVDIYYRHSFASCFPPPFVLVRKWFNNDGILHDLMSK